MPMARRLALLVLFASFPGWAAPVSAFDGSDAAPQGSKSAGTLSLFKNPSQAFRQGMDGYRSGNFKTSVEAFEYAAANGNPLARWKLGRMYAVGDGVPQDDAKAFDYFSQIIDNYDEDDGDPRQAPSSSS